MINPIKRNGLWISSELPPESLQLGALRLCRVAWRSKNWQKLNSVSYFN